MFCWRGAGRYCDIGSDAALRSNDRFRSKAAKLRASKTSPVCPRFDAGEYLNQCCASAPQLESILRGQMGKIFLQQYRPKAVITKVILSPRRRGRAARAA